MSHLFQKIEASLLPVVIPYAPEGTDPKAVVHQWAHAVANNSELVGRVDASSIGGLKFSGTETYAKPR